jgi:SAM-dependent methyltransferase
MSMTARPSHRSRWRAVLQDTGDRLFDRYLGIETAGAVWQGELEFGSEAGLHYQPSNWLNLVLLGQLLRDLRVSRSDAFIDFGCGKGQVLALASRFPFGRVIGLDLSPSLLERAERNMERIRGRATAGALELVQANALHYTVPDDLTIAYFYMPFPTPVYEQVAANIAASLARRPRTFRIIYLEQAAPDREVPGRHGFRLVKQRRRMAMYASTPDDREPQPVLSPTRDEPAA